MSLFPPLRFIIVQGLLGLLAVVVNTDRVMAQTGKTPAEPSFKKEIEPLLKSKCWKCHGQDAQKGELALHTPALIRKGSESGAVVVSGNASSSRLYEMVRQGEMPPDNMDPLTEQELELVRRWIDAGASFDDDAEEQKPAVTVHDVLPILFLRCATCHGRQKQEGGLDVRTKESLLRGGKSGPAIALGKPDDSLVLKRIRAAEMPPHQKLIEASVKPMEPDEVKILTQWIELRAPIAPEEADLAGTVNDPLVRPDDKNFWSFRPPRPVSIPKIDDSRVDTSRHRYWSAADAFIAEKLLGKGLTISSAADPAALLRRATYDLTGLPPSPTEIDDYLADKSPDRFARVVDRLLASPRYGERWGRHWLDVAGYADCEGRREQHMPRPFAWRYRDYVIRSMNLDKPYDRFLLEQLAGDDLADYEHATTITQELEDNLVATAFLKMPPDPTWANLTDFVPDRLEVVADSIDVLGSGVMGMTFKCARCHTHKFDPIPQRDYYRLVTMLKGAFDEHDWLKPRLQSFGGAGSIGFGERLLPYVKPDELAHWNAELAEFDKQLAALKAQEKTPDLEKKIKDFETKRPPKPQLMALWDRGEPSPTYMYRRGNYLTPGALVGPGVPAVLSDPDRPVKIDRPWPGAKSTGRRLALAKWLVDPRHPLTARVMVNRVWKHHFGQGIVRSLGNFGKTGDRPTHPELLDHLALEFIRHGFQLKAMHRQLVLSAVYQQPSTASDNALSLDPANTLLSRMPLQRLDAEQLRDSLLVLAGELNDAMGGKPEPVQVKPDGLVLTGRRRSIYVEQLRKHPPSLLETFDFPAMNPNCLQRTDSLVPTQALHLWNDTAIRNLADQFAGRILAGDDAGKFDVVEQQLIDRVYRYAIGRPARDDERDVCVRALSTLKAEWLRQGTGQSGTPTREAQNEATKKALTAVCHTLFNSADFLYLD